MQNAPFTKAIKEKLFDLPKHHPKLGKVKEYEKSNSKNARNTKRQNLKPVKNDRSGLLVLRMLRAFDIFFYTINNNFIAYSIKSKVLVAPGKNVKWNQQLLQCFLT